MTLPSSPWKSVSDPDVKTKSSNSLTDAPDKKILIFINYTVPKTYRGSLPKLYSK